MDDKEKSDIEAEAARRGRGRPAGSKNAPKDDSVLSAETLALAEAMVGGIQRNRPHDDARPQTVDALVSMALSDLRTRTERVFPEYFEVKPAAVREIKSAA